MDNTPSSSTILRILQDRMEMENEPYPNIEFRFDDQNIREVCLLLKPENSKTLHLFVQIPANYPASAPKIHCDSLTMHPNVMDGFQGEICMDELDGAWDPAISLRSLAILLLCFLSDTAKIEQKDYNDDVVDVGEYRREAGSVEDDFACGKCGFNASKEE